MSQSFQSTFAEHQMRVEKITFLFNIYLNVPHSVLISLATLPAAQGVQELAPSVLTVFPSQRLQNVLFSGW
jgi:hypothetical protein